MADERKRKQNMVDERKRLRKRLKHDAGAKLGAQTKTVKKQTLKTVKKRKTENGKKTPSAFSCKTKVM